MVQTLRLLAVGIVLLAGVSGARAEGAPPLSIVKAVYGVLPGGKFVNATEKVAARVKDGKLRVEALNDLFGDPAEGARKRLKVEYLYKGQPGEASVEEGETLLLPPPKLAGPLTIKKAVYGDLPDGEVVVVTDDVKRAVKENALKIEVSNDLFGDPAPGAFKRLKVEYRIGDVELTKYAWEGNTLLIRY
jgi:hypothetical protein